MCVTSAIMDYGRQTEIWTLPKIEQFERLIKEAKEYDKANDEPHCEDPKKAEFEKELEATKLRLQKLEKLEALYKEVAQLESELGLQPYEPVTSASIIVHDIGKAQPWDTGFIISAQNWQFAANTLPFLANEIVGR